MNTHTRTRTAEDIRSQFTTLLSELATLAGKPVTVWMGSLGDVADTPEGGALLHVSWAVEDQSYTDWYPSLKAAKAALLALAYEHDRVPNEGGLYVDLTAAGCRSGSATIERRRADLAGKEPTGEKVWRYRAEGAREQLANLQSAVRSLLGSHDLYGSVSATQVARLAAWYAPYSEDDDTEGNPGAVIARGVASVGRLAWED